MENIMEGTSEKTGMKTSEFYVAIATGIFGILTTLGVFTPEQATDLTASVGTIAGAVITAITTMGYAISRGLAKKK